MSIQKTSNQNSNSFTHFSNKMYGNSNDWLSKDNNSVFNKFCIIFFFTVFFLIFSDIARVHTHPFYCVLFAYGSVISSANTIRYLCHLTYFSQSISYFAEKLAWIICLPFLITLWLGEKFFIKLKADGLISFIPDIIVSLTFYCFLGLRIISFIFQNIASNMSLAAIIYNNPLLNAETCCSLIIFAITIVMFLLHTLTCMFIFKLGIAFHVTTSSYESLKKGFKNINELFFAIIVALIFLLNPNDIDALFLNAVSEGLKLSPILSKFF